MLNKTALLPTSDATAQFAVNLAARLEPGDVVLLTGPVGAGKTHFARAAIQSMLDVIEDVPSPTFTLIQTYDTDQGEVWHADLYRLTSTFEIEELGLTDAFTDCICLIEWPDRLGDMRPFDALDITLEPLEAEDGRRLTAKWSDPRWAKRLEGI